MAFPSSPTVGQQVTESGRAYQWTGTVWNLASVIAGHAATHATGGADVISNVISSPSQITGNQNDYSLTGADIYRLSSDAARTITGISLASSGTIILLVNVGSFAITLSHQSASSTAANRIIVPWSGDCVIAAGASVTLVYDSTTSRWRVL